MKKLLLFLLVFSVTLLMSGCSKKESASNDSKDKTEKKSEDKKDITFSENSTYHVKYDAKGDKVNGTMEMWIKGKNVKMDMNMDEKGKKVNSDMYFVDKIAYIVTDMEGKKMGMKMDISKEMEKGDDPTKDIVNIKEKLKDYQKLGTDEVLGYKCDVYQTKEGTKLSIYKEYFALKIVDKNNNTYVATAFEPDIKTADDFFTPPKDVEFMDMGNMKNMMK